MRKKNCEKRLPPGSLRKNICRQQSHTIDVGGRCRRLCPSSSPARVYDAASKSTQNPRDRRQKNKPERRRRHEIQTLLPVGETSERFQSVAVTDPRLADSFAEPA